MAPNECNSLLIFPLFALNLVHMGQDEKAMINGDWDLSSTVVNMPAVSAELHSHHAYMITIVRDPYLVFIELAATERWSMYVRRILSRTRL